MSHIWMSHVTSMNESCQTCEWVMSKHTTGWRRPIGSLVFIGHFPQKIPIIHGSFPKRDLQIQASYASLPPCIPTTHTTNDTVSRRHTLPMTHPTTGWRRPLGCLIFIGHFPQKSPIINGSLWKETCIPVSRRHILPTTHTTIDTVFGRHILPTTHSTVLLTTQYSDYTFSQQHTLLTTHTCAMSVGIWHSNKVSLMRRAGHVSLLQCVVVCCSGLQWVSVCCSVLQCVVDAARWPCLDVAVCSSVLQCIAVCCRVSLMQRAGRVSLHCDMTHSYVQHEWFIHM